MTVCFSCLQFLDWVSSIVNKCPIRWLDSRMSDHWQSGKETFVVIWIFCVYFGGVIHTQKIGENFCIPILALYRKLLSSETNVWTSSAAAFTTRWCFGWISCIGRQHRPRQRNIYKIIISTLRLLQSFLIIKIASGTTKLFARIFLRDRQLASKSPWRNIKKFGHLRFF